MNKFYSFFTKLFKLSDKERQELQSKIDELTQRIIDVTKESDKTCMELRAKYAPAPTAAGQIFERREKNELKAQIASLEKALAMEATKSADNHHVATVAKSKLLDLTKERDNLLKKINRLQKKLRYLKKEKYAGRHNP